MCFDMTQIQWKLKPYLEQTSVTPHKLALEAGISPPNLYTLIRGEGAKNVSRDTLGKLIGALRRLTGQPVTPNDLLEVIEEPVEETISEKAWLDSSAADLLERLEEIEKDVPKEEVQAWLESFQKSGTPIKYDPDTRSFIGGAK